MPPRVRNKDIVVKIFLVSIGHFKNVHFNGHFKNVHFILLVMNSFLNFLFYFSVDEIVKLLELIPQQLDMKNYNETCVKAIIRLNSALKQHGSQLEHLHRNLLDKAQVFYTEGWFKR